MKSFNKIMGKFNKVIADLEALSKIKKEEKQFARSEMIAIEQKIKTISEEESASKEVAGKLKELFVASSQTA